MSIYLDTRVQYLKGVGPKLGSYLEHKGFYTVADLLGCFPRAYEDRRANCSLNALKIGEVVNLKAQIVNVSSFQVGGAKKTKIWDVLIQDKTGKMHCKFFRTPYRGYFERFRPGLLVRIVGKVSEYRGQLIFNHPDIQDWTKDEVLEDALVPIYSEIDGISSQKLHRLICVALNELENSSDTDLYVEFFSHSVIEKNGLLSRRTALKQIHCPPKGADGTLYNRFSSLAHYRFIFEEFFEFELYLAYSRFAQKKTNTIPMKPLTKLSDQLLQRLGFNLTQGQLLAFKDISNDLINDQLMHRLVQGDVGCGKTLVAFLSALLVIENGFQVSLMVPTEILAEQHFLNAKNLLGPLGIEVILLTGKMKVQAKRETIKKISQSLNHGEAFEIQEDQKNEGQLIIGTHALLQESVQFSRLGLVIIDEQHRFGVHQRGRLKEKATFAHMLVLTATPIPRSLAMTAYGDLDVSIIRDLPSGRQPIQTRAGYESNRLQLYDFLKKQIENGRQAYVVYPLVEESEKLDLKDAINGFSYLSELFPQFSVGLLHGRMKHEEKEQVMNEFRLGKIQILVSTTVIEVGVDVANANLMVIEHAERFGLSQLHQLRGRVGRGKHKSFCILMLGKALSEESRFRVKVMENNSDGFKIAEADLELRGPGELLGTKQSGLGGFKIAHLIRDIEILVQARKSAFEIIKNDPYLEKTENQLLKKRIEIKKHTISSG